MKPNVFLSLFCLAATLLVGCRSTATFSAKERNAQLRPEQLRCEYHQNPIGLDELRPRLTWQLASTGRARLQKAYRIQVASNPGLLAEDAADLWDSGKVLSDATANLPYRGNPLASRQQCYWRDR